VFAINRLYVFTSSCRFYANIYYLPFVLSIVKKLNPCHNRVASLQRSHSVLRNCRTPRCALCKRQQRCGNAVRSHRTSCVGVYFEHAQNKRRGLAFPQRVRQHAVATLWQHYGVFKSDVGSLWARRVHAEKTPCKFCIWSRRLQCILIIKQEII